MKIFSGQKTFGLKPSDEKADFYNNVFSKFSIPTELPKSDAFYEFMQKVNELINQLF